MMMLKGKALKVLVVMGMVVLIRIIRMIVVTSGDDSSDNGVCGGDSVVRDSENDYGDKGDRD